MARSAGSSRVTIEDVAAHAGVSIATVSRVVNDRYGVSRATVERVSQIIEELGYESSLVARSLRSQRTNVIGILVPQIESFSAELLKGAALGLQGSEFELVVYCGGSHREKGWERRSVSRLSGTLADGIILVTPSVVEVTSSHPIIAVDPNVGGATMPVVDAQNLEGARSATAHLIGLGHRRIGFLAGRPDLESARRREDGYRAALAEAGIDYDPDLVRVGGFLPETSAEPARELLARDDRPTAIFAANDLSAIVVLRVAAELGLSVPDDLSVVGFDNIPESSMSEPPLTTIDQSIQSQGQEAVRLLIEMIEHPGHTSGKDPVHITLPTELVERRSTGPVAPSRS